MTTWRAGLTVLLALHGLGSVGTQAQSNWSRVPVPLYSPENFMQSVHRYWTAPKAAQFATQSKLLTLATQSLCASPGPGSAAALQVARKQWQTTMAAWERLSTVAFGPLIERRSRRLIDFSPPRPALIERAIRAAPADAVAMESVGAPAKGFPALEWLLWSHPVKPHSPECQYGLQVAAEIEREAVALQLAFEQAAKKEWDKDAATTAMSEVVNQWIGGIERLRWTHLEKPLRAGDKTYPLPRSASTSSVISWAAQWEALRAYAMFTGENAPQPGTALVPLESFLRGRGNNKEADALVRATVRADVGMQKLESTAGPRVLNATRGLAEVKRMAEAELAPALKVNVGFSDADGD